MHTVRYIDEIEFVDDTKAEDLLSTRDSFKCLDKPSLWLTVGTSHERDFTLIEKQVKKRVKAIVAYGGDTDDMRDKLQDMVEVFQSVPGLAEAVETCYKLANPDDLILYSPSCKAEDGYLNHVDRSRAYSRLISEIEKRDE
jgi:UDP-N-acetylmuramoylalanine--D-glutamate ligase